MAGSLWHSAKPTFASSSLHFNNCLRLYLNPLVDTFPPTIIETYKDANKIEAGKASG